MDEPDDRPDATPGVGVGVVVFMLVVGTWLLILGGLFVVVPWFID